MKTTTRARIPAFGQMFSWRRIESHYWETPTGKAVIVRLQCGGFRKICPAIAVLVPPRLKPRIEALMERYQAEWPA